jgi:hypothetical protein
MTKISVCHTKREKEIGREKSEKCLPFMLNFLNKIQKSIGNMICPARKSEIKVN